VVGSKTTCCLLAEPISIFIRIDGSRRPNVKQFFPIRGRQMNNLAANVFARYKFEAVSVVRDHFQSLANLTQIKINFSIYFLLLIFSENFTIESHEFLAGDVPSFRITFYIKELDSYVCFNDKWQPKTFVSPDNDDQLVVSA
jgi:hypothetical protein